jgi:hypothetical protein
MAVVIQLGWVADHGSPPSRPTVQVDVIAGQLDAPRAGRGGIVLFRGLPRMGKSALLDEAAYMARERRIRVFHGSGDAAQVTGSSRSASAVLASARPVVRSQRISPKMGPRQPAI